MPFPATGILRLGSSCARADHKVLHNLSVVRAKSSSSGRRAVQPVKPAGSSGEVSLSFPWQVKPFRHFPRDAKPIKIPGCGFLSRRLALRIVQGQVRRFSKTPFRYDEFANSVADKVVALSEAISANDSQRIAELCHFSLAKVLIAASIGLPKQGVSVSLQFEDKPKVRLAGATLMAYHTREDPRALLESSGADGARMLAPVRSMPFMPFYGVMVSEGHTGGVSPDKAQGIMMTVYAHIHTRESFALTKDSQVLAGSKEMQNSAHVMSLQTLLLPRQQPAENMAEASAFDTQGWKFSDIDLLLLRMAAVKRTKS